MWDNANPGAVYDPELFRRDILPRLAPVKLAEIAEEAGCSKAYASDIRRGKWTLHVSTWAALAELVGISLDVDARRRDRHWRIRPAGLFWVGGCRRGLPALGPGPFAPVPVAFRSAPASGSFGPFRSAGLPRHPPGRPAYRLLVGCGCPVGWDTPDMPVVVVCPKQGNARVA